MSSQVKKSTTQEEVYLFNDYFVNPNDQGIEVSIPFQGKDLKFRIRRSLTLKEKQSASDAAIAFEIDEEGRPLISKMDQSAYVLEILIAGLKAWPFTYPQDYPDSSLAGKPVPINRETISMLDSRLQEAVSSRILGMGVAQAQAIAPFGMKSGVAS